MRPDILNRPIVLYFRICWIITFGRTSSCHRHVAAKMLDILESKGIISMPAILKGEEVGKEHFGDICFIVLDSAAE